MVEPTQRRAAERVKTRLCSAIAAAAGARPTARDVRRSDNVAAAQPSSAASSACRTQLQAGSQAGRRRTKRSATGRSTWPLVRRMLAALRPFRSGTPWAWRSAHSQHVLEMVGPKFMQNAHQLHDRCRRRRAGAEQRARRDRARLHRHRRAGRLTLAVSIILQRYTILVMTRAGERVQFDIRRKLFAHLQQLSMSYYDKTKLGRIISRCTSDIDAMREVNVWGLHTIVANSHA